MTLPQALIAFVFAAGILTLTPGLDTAIVLRASALWAVWVWAVLIRNMLTDHGATWGFRVVHIGLAIVSIAFALATWAIARTGRRRPRSDADPSS